MNLKKFTTCIENPNLLDSNSLQELKVLLEKYPYFQAAHLLYLKNQNMVDENFQITENQSVVHISDRKKLYNLIHNIKESSGAVASLEELDTQSNESFIAQLARQAKELKSSRVEIQMLENKPLVSETLAKIFVSQGHYQQAIEAYQKLAESYPEKKSHFESLIQQLKEANGLKN